ncbi:Ltp family lipoprotein [Enorma massiliensis]|uniref:Ltp family lipoprotein n=1 Tax=Enorma massiliensis TaxID=1472761 RepID=UPI003208F7AA
MQADWNANALAKAREYQETMSMSSEAIRDQLTSEYGEKFTQEEADYAIANL